MMIMLPIIILFHRLSESAHLLNIESGSKFHTHAFHNTRMLSLIYSLHIKHVWKFWPIKCMVAHFPCLIENKLNSTRLFCKIYIIIRNHCMKNSQQEFFYRYLWYENITRFSTQCNSLSKSPIFLLTVSSQCVFLKVDMFGFLKNARFYK